MCSTGWFKQNCFRSHCSPIVGGGGGHLQTPCWAITDFDSPDIHPCGQTPPDSLLNPLRQSRTSPEDHSFRKGGCQKLQKIVVMLQIYPNLLGSLFGYKYSLFSCVQTKIHRTHFYLGSVSLRRFQMATWHSSSFGLYCLLSLLAYETFDWRIWVRSDICPH